MMTDRDKLKAQIDRQAHRMKKAEHERDTLTAQTMYVGMLGLLFVLPVIVGAYLGQWLDRQASGFSAFWTALLIIVGVIIGAINVYLYIRE
ncbi:MAG: AtpZ/AtpI family protein [Gammaproteobacteria bacterium]